MMNTRTREEIGPREGRGMSLSDSMRCQKKIKMNQIKKKIVGTISARNQGRKKKSLFKIVDVNFLIIV